MTYFNGCYTALTKLGFSDNGHLARYLIPGALGAAGGAFIGGKDHRAEGALGGAALGAGIGHVMSPAYMGRSVKKPAHVLEQQRKTKALRDAKALKAKGAVNNAVAKPPVAKPPVAKPPVAKPPVAKPPVAKPPVASNVKPPAKRSLSDAESDLKFFREMKDTMRKKVMARPLAERELITHSDYAMLRGFGEQRRAAGHKIPKAYTDILAKIKASVGKKMD
jgi:hypothetical protein